MLGRTTVTEANLTFPSSGAMSFAALRRPLKTDERRAVCGERGFDPEVFRVLADRFGEPVAEQVAQRLVCAMMLESMNAAMLDARRGPVPMFIKRLERSVKTFNRHIR